MTEVRIAVGQAGGRVVIEAPPWPDSMAKVSDARPNIVILRPQGSGAPDFSSFTAAGHPVVLFTCNTHPSMLEAAARAGVMALLAEPLQPAQLVGTLDLAIARFSDWDRVRRKLAERKLIERAKGRLMAEARLTEDAAFQWLRTRAMDTRSTLGEVAKTLLDGIGARAGARRELVSPPGAGRR
jgi:response regulator NasT